MENTIANIGILDVVRIVHGYFIFVFLIINMLSSGADPETLLTGGGAQLWSNN